MRLVDLSMTVEECDSTPFAKEEAYFKSRPIVRWEDKGFVSSMVEMTVHAGTHIDSPHHFFRDKPSVEALPLESMIGEAVVMDLTFKGQARARITPDALDHAVGRKGEQMALGLREIYVLYDEGMGQSKLRIPATKTGTARNLNTVAKLAAMAAEL